MADADIPLPLVLAACLGIAGTFYSFFFPFFLVGPPLITIILSPFAAVLSAYCLFNIVLMRFKSLLAYFLLFTGEQMLLMLTGIWSVYTIIAPPVVILASLCYLRDFHWGNHYS